MKKPVALLLVLLLALPLPALAAGAPGVALAGFFSDLMRSRDNVISYTPVPSSAFPSDEYWVIGGTPDGQKLLITNMWLDLFVWDRAANARLPLTFSRPEDEERFILQLDQFILRNRDKDQQAGLQKQLAAVREKYLAQHGLDRFQSLNQIVDSIPRGETMGRTLCLSSNERYAYLINEWMELLYLLDWGKAEIRSIPAAFFYSLCGDRFLHCDRGGQGAVIDLNTWEETPVDLLLGTFGQIQEVTGARLLQDGSIAVLGRSEIVSDEESKKMKETDYLILRAGRLDAVCLLLGDSYNLGTPDQILVTEDGLFALAYNHGRVLTDGSCLIDLNTYAVTAVDSSLCPVAALENKFLVYDANANSASTYYYYTLQPDTMEKTALASDNGGADPAKLRLWGITALGGLNLQSGNLLFSFSEHLQGYYTVSLKEN